ncbi:hypothetical protein QUB63_13575 [Microcoleus sp. ARI1-B5]|uniref:hypothetical protein n=1 Tax=unclassified Microcoleus TaxID=2642155 RepID=UPI002FD55BC1
MKAIAFIRGEQLQSIVREPIGGDRLVEADSPNCSGLYAILPKYILFTKRD